MRFGVAVFSLLVWASWVAFITLFPFDFTASDGRGFVEHPLTGRVDDLALNLLLFLPLGALLHSEGRRRSLGLRHILLLSVGTGAVLSASVEYLQLFLPNRFPSLVDVGSNTAGAFIGVSLHRRWAVSLASSVFRLRNSASGVYVLSVMAVLTVVALGGSAALQARTQLTDWDVSYPLTVGNERTGNRPWRGRVYTIELTNAATPLGSLQRFAEGRPTVIPGTRIAAYDLSGAAPYSDKTGQLPNLMWMDNSRVHWADAAGTSKNTWLRTESAVGTIAHRVRESNAFSLRVKCATDDVRQDGPARIVSNESDSERGNLMLGQGQRHLSIRVRTPHTGDIPISPGPDFVVPDVFSDAGLRDILVTYDGASVRAAVANVGRVHHFELSPGSSLVAAATDGVFLSELQRYKIVYIAGLFLIPGVLVYVLCQTWRNRLAWSAFWVFGFTFLYEATLVHVSGRPFETTSAATTFIVAVLVFLATLVIPAGLIEPSRAQTSGPSLYIK